MKISSLLTAPAIIVTAVMEECLGVLRSDLGRDGIHLWTGAGQVGKTTTARWCVDRFKQEFDESDPDTFTAQWIQLASTHRGSAQKTTMAMLESLGVPVRPASLRMTALDSQTRHVVSELRRQRILVWFIDEAGLLPDEGLRHVAQIHDTAHKNDWPVKIVLVGMNDLPSRITNQPQLNGRVEIRKTFEPIEEQDQRALIVQDLPWIDDLDPSEASNIVKQLGQRSQGLPGRLVRLLTQVRQIIDRGGIAPNAASVSAILTRLMLDRQATIDFDMGGA